MFGGTINKSETVLEGLKRELNEELEYDISAHKVQKLGVFEKTKDIDGIDYTIHVFVIDNVHANKLVVHEGSIFAAENNKEIIKNTKLTRITKLSLMSFITSKQ